MFLLQVLESAYAQELTMRPDVVSVYIEKIESLPAWTSVEESAVDRYRLQYDSLGNAFRTLPINDARRIVEQFSARYVNMIGFGKADESLSKLYPLLRYYFDVPQRELRTKAKFFGGWMSNSSADSDTEVDLLWPLTIKDGRPTLTHGFLGALGPRYDPVGEFEYFESNYGHRSRENRK